MALFATLKKTHLSRQTESERSFSANGHTGRVGKRQLHLFAFAIFGYFRRVFVVKMSTWDNVLCGYISLLPT